MSQYTPIEWTDATWNPTRGCTKVSPGCKNCFAERIAALDDPLNDIGGPFRGFAIMTDHGPQWTGKVELIESKLTEPMRWKKARRVFVNSMSDLFHENLPDEAIDRVFAVMAQCPQHTFQILTKRAERMRKWFDPRRWENIRVAAAIRTKTVQPEWDWPLPNVWLGVSIENRATLGRADYLRETPAAVRFLSLEPLLEDLGPLNLAGIDWVIAGGESGPGARPTDPQWFRDVRDQCQAASVPFFFKQWGGFQKGKNGSTLDGKQWKEFPTAGRSYAPESRQARG
jgi:protein gp37